MIGTRRTAALAALLLAGCAAPRLRPVAPPDGPRAFGVTFGAPPEAAAQALAAAGAALRPDPADLDALVAEPCPGAPSPGPCRLRTGPAGLYALEQEVPLADAEALAAAVARGLGPPATPVGADPDLVAAWAPPGWTVAVARHPALAPPVATLRAEWDAATPPTVAGVPLGRRRAEVEQVLMGQGATLLQRDDEATSYLGCPLGEPEAVSCTVTFVDGRAAAVTELLPGLASDRAALEAWQARADALARDYGRPPEVRCPPGGPDRTEGDCTATWRSERLVVVLGAHRSAGGQHRGGLSVYLGFSYPPLGPGL